jgi:hypothetical protein
MAEQIQTITTKIVDGYGGVYPEAFVMIREESETTQKTKIANEQVGEYDKEFQVLAKAYRLSFFCTETTKNNGERSRPLLYKNESGAFSDLFDCDITSESALSIINSDISDELKSLRLIKNDIAQRFA